MIERRNIQRERGNVVRERLLALVNHCNREGKRLPTQYIVAKSFGCHVSTIWKHFAILRRAGKLSGYGHNMRTET